MQASMIRVCESTHLDSQWVAGRLATLTPTWSSNVARARALVDVRTSATRRITFHQLLAVAGAVALIIAAIAPPGRALAQELWYRLLITRADVVRLDLSLVPLDTSIRTDGLQQQVGDTQEAARIAGFAPFLPSKDVLAEAPALSVAGPIEITQTIRTADLQAALMRVGASDVEVPVQWNGVSLRAVIGPLVVAQYPGDIEVLQATPIHLDLPAGFPLAQFAEVAFRSAGLSWWEARKLGQEFASRPAWLLDVPDNQLARVETFPAGDSFLIDEIEDDGQRRVTVIMSRATRVYSVSTPTREMSLRVAGALR
jgi:hypothetical protein